MKKYQVLKFGEINEKGHRYIYNLDSLIEKPTQVPVTLNFPESLKSIDVKDIIGVAKLEYEKDGVYATIEMIKNNIISEIIKEGGKVNFRTFGSAEINEADEIKNYKLLGVAPTTDPT